MSGWVLSSSSVCSGVSRSHEVIEFPLLNISSGTSAGNPSEMKWTADMCRGASTEAESSVGFAIIKTRTAQVARSFHRGRHTSYDLKTVLHTGTKGHNMCSHKSKCVLLISLQIRLVFTRHTFSLTSPPAPCSIAKLDQSAQWFEEKVC